MGAWIRGVTPLNPKPQASKPKAQNLHPEPPNPKPQPPPQTEALATAAVRAATKLRAALIVVFTVTGRTARLIAKYRPHQPVLTVRCAVLALMVHCVCCWCWNVLHCVCCWCWWCWCCVMLDCVGFAILLLVLLPCDHPATTTSSQNPFNPQHPQPTPPHTHQVVVPAVTTSNGLKWVCSGDYVARQCLQYRGVIPVCADAKFGRQDGAVLSSALKVVRGWGLGGIG